MPEAPAVAAADAPEIVQSQPQQPLTAPLDPGLRALIDRVMPMPSEKAPEAPEQPETSPEAPPATTPEPKPAAEKGKTEYRLAPDDDEPANTQEPAKPALPEVPEITDE